jgi:uncharacterized protein (TIGR00266 family)
MNQSTFEIVLTGDLVGDASFNEACERLAAMFKMPVERAQQIVNNAPKVLKSGLDLETAKRYQQAVEKAGLKIDVQPVSAVKAAPESKSAAAESAAPVVSAVTQSTADAEVEQKEVEQKEELKPVKPTSVAPPSEPEHFKGLSFTIDARPDFSFLTVKLPANQMLKVEASAMATMDTHLVMKTKMKGGLSRLLSSESIFINEFTAQGGAGEIGIAPATPGDLVHRYLSGETLYLQSSAFVASSPNVVIETKWQGLTKGFFSGESLFLIRASGEGDLWFNSYGAIIELDVTDGYVVDTGNIVAFTDGMEYSISKVGGYKSLFFSGEGFVCRFKGKGKIWIQTRSVGAFTGWAQYYRPVKGG